MAHLGCGVQRCHPIIGSDAWICPAVLHQVLDDLKVTLLAGQVEGRGTILCLGIDNSKRDAKEELISADKAWMAWTPLKHICTGHILFINRK